MRVADVIFKFLTDKDVNTVFMITGGQAMFLNDAVYQNKILTTIFNHHEQAVGMSAEAYGRITGKLGVAVVTAGPGGINVLNGVVGGWTDSSPMMILSGQSPLYNVQYEEETKIRQFGVQGINIKPLVEGVTKYFVTVDDPLKTLYYIEEAYYMATTGRPGPVWIDIPLNIQGIQVDIKKLKHYIPPKKINNQRMLKKSVIKTIKLLQRAKRPLLLVGQGVRIAKAIPELEEILDKTNIPIITSRLGIDIISSDHPLFIGRPGTYGERTANFAVQNADLIVAIGSRLATSMIGYNAKDFGRNAKKVVVDIDQKELDKPGPEITLKILSDAKDFLSILVRFCKNYNFPNYDEWVKICQKWKKQYPVVLSTYKEEKPVNSYYFTSELAKLSSPEDMILVDTGGCFHTVCQTWKIKKGQRFLTTGGISSMGYWAAGIGACLANKRRRTFVITGDGSLQMNIQELATVKYNNLPIKLFVFNNNGYSLIRQTQKNMMEGRLFGESPATGLWCPDSLEIAKAYKIKGVRIHSVEEIKSKLKEVLEHKGPVICDILTPEWQLLIPRTISEKKKDGTLVTRSYEDMYPFLDPQELAKNMIAEKGNK